MFVSLSNYVLQNLDYHLLFGQLQIHFDSDRCFDRIVLFAAFEFIIYLLL